MKCVDLSQFQFDYDLKWAAMFFNADDTVYARYETQSAADADAYNSIASVEKTMRRVLAVNEDYSKRKRARRKIGQAQAVQDRTGDARHETSRETLPEHRPEQLCSMPQHSRRSTRAVVQGTKIPTRHTLSLSFAEKYRLHDKPG